MILRSFKILLTCTVLLSLGICITCYHKTTKTRDHAMLSEVFHVEDLLKTNVTSTEEFHWIHNLPEFMVQTYPEMTQLISEKIDVIFAEHLNLHKTRLLARFSPQITKIFWGILVGILLEFVLNWIIFIWYTLLVLGAVYQILPLLVVYFIKDHSITDISSSHVVSAVWTAVMTQIEEYSSSYNGH